MPITFGCASCGKLMRVADALAGKSVRCPHCQAVIAAPDDIPIAPVVPPPPPPPPATPPEPEPKEQVWAEATRKPRRGKRPTTPREWAAFGDACQTLSVGIWIEFAAYVVVFLIVFYAAVMTESRTRPGPPVVAQVLIAVFFIALVVGSVFTAIGRFKMWTLPADAGVGGLTAAAAILSLLRVLVLLGSGLMVLNSFDDTTRNLTGGFGFLFLGLALGWLTDVAVLPALGVLGGMVPGRRLRSAVGALALFVLLSVLGWVVMLVVLGAFTDSPYGGFGSDPAPGRTTTGGRSDPTKAIFVLGIGGVLLVVYAIMHQAVYQAGRAEARRPTDEDSF